MIRAGAALSRHADPARAAAEAAAGARAAAGDADAALVFAAGHGEGAARAAAAAVEALGTRAVAGAAAHGVLAGCDEEEERPAVAVLALAGLAATPFRMPDLAGLEDAAGDELAAALGRPAAPGDLVVLFVDPVALDLRRLLGACDAVLPPGALVGAAAAIGPDGRAGLAWSGREVLAGGACGLVLHLPRPARVLVPQGCRPITDPLPVTRSDGHWVLELGGRPALDVYREVAGAPLAADLRRSAERVVVALPRGASDTWVARPVAGFAPARRAFALAEDLKPGAPLRLALRDADLAREDLRRALAGAAPAAAALLLGCSGRGRGLFRHAGLEAALVARALGATPLAGAFGAFPLGPAAGASALHAYAAVLALLDG